ncbi:MAG: S46 family peptidase [Myxococcales bacterium]|nr:S46 family peptidase [Myxococcales bacterium]
MAHPVRWMIALSLLLLFSSLLQADEGMWTFDHPPVAAIEKQYGVKLSPEWLEHLRMSSVRLDGGSASFISADGLILTNHHVATGCIDDLSTEKRDYLATGFDSRLDGGEKKCPTLEARVLYRTEEVTGQVKAAIPEGIDDTAAATARRAVLGRLEKECQDRTGLTCEAVTLHGGGQFWIYQYQIYRDLRLVFAPEMQLAFFGGDDDNFNFPRFCLDFALVRAYGPDGKPAHPPHHLKINPAGVKEGEPVFISGHPGSSQRFFTFDQLKFLRDVAYPFRLKQLKRLNALLEDYAKTGEEPTRRAKTLTFYIQNGIKAYTGNLAGLQRADLMSGKEKEEAELRRVAIARPEFQSGGDPWEQIAKAQQAHAQFLKRYRLVQIRYSQAFSLAADIVRLNTELTKPNEQRLEEYQEANLDSLYHDLFAEVPIYPDLEEAILADALAQLRDELGGDDPLVKAVLKNRDPKLIAKEAVGGTKLLSAPERKKWAKAGVKAIAAAKDPLLRLVLAIDPYFREMRQRYESEVRIVEERAGMRIAQARFAIRGNQVYPDATFTLRLAYGKMAGYEANGYRLPYQTTLYGLFDRHFNFAGRAPFNLPARWLEKAGSLKLETPYNQVNTAETFGGNSGSPLVDQNGELVGLVFDGNLESLGIEFVYDDKEARSLTVSPQAILESLAKVYGREDLVRELLGR